MTEIKLYNTKTRQKEPFSPLDEANVRMYVCGPTVYDRAHIGNARPVIVFDVLYRLLRHVYGADHVTYARNFTDVDDKINARAANTGRSIREITDETIGWFLEDMDALGALRPNQAPRATEYIDEMKAMIAALIAKGHAYAAEGHVLFDVNSYEKYGSLSGRSLDDMIAGARVEIAPYKRNPMDFVLWKPSDSETPGWQSDWGYGRPGWHIECSAMTRALFGEQFDIHGGGLDLAFPHHENEKAQSCCTAGEDSFAQVWMHNEMLQVEGKKMSKSLGNFFSVRELLDKGISGEVIRFVYLSTHYRKPMDWTEKKAREAEATLRKWCTVEGKNIDVKPDAEVVAALMDDLNTSAAIHRLEELYKADDRDLLLSSAKLLGFDFAKIAESDWARPFTYETPTGGVLKEGVDYNPSASVIGWGPISDGLRDASLNLVHRWLAYRRNKDWAAADGLKEHARELGMSLMAVRSPNGINGGSAKLESNEIDPEKLDALK
ncbi:MAG: cysteine--tRNA ligase [Alphaproteobacteria bacterium]|nr:cysteine--tRNA ligase [Alphaproteobacteria bacterium]